METAYIINKEKTLVTGTKNGAPASISLLPHQQLVIDEAPRKTLLAYEPGTGKTIASIGLCNKHNAREILVICPKTLVIQWAVELDKYANDGVTYKIISKELFKKEVKNLEKYGAVIGDEAHFYAGINSALSKALYWYLNKHKVEIICLNTATPYCSTPFNIYTLAKHLGYNWNYMDFKNKFYVQVPMGARSVPVLRNGIEGEVAELVKRIGYTITFKEVAELKQGKMAEQTTELRTISLTDNQLQAIEDVFDPVFIVRWTKQHQIENGFLYEEGSPTIKFASKKEDELIKICKKHDKLIVVARYQEQLTSYEKRLTAEGITTFVLSGKTKDRDTVIAKANESARCVFLVQASISEGYELPSFRTTVFASLSFSHKDHIQMKGRNLRINNIQENKTYYLVADGVDRDVYECIMKKKDFHAAIYYKEGAINNN